MQSLAGDTAVPSTSQHAEVQKQDGISQETGITAGGL